jgi:uncharacterized protein (TIGR04255 family)
LVTFPKSERVLFRNNPLAEVICQLRFPPQLRIDVEAPSALQEALRDHYPILSIGRSLHARLQANGQTRGEGMVVQKQEGNLYDFTSSGKDWKVTLANNFLALSTITYTRWEDFFSRLQLVAKAFSEVYSPPFFTRVGLRYQDIISREALGLAKKAWSSLLVPELVGPLASKKLGGADVETYRTIYRVQINQRPHCFA